jgi:hypothetical protein
VNELGLGIINLQTDVQLEIRMNGTYFRNSEPADRFLIVK